MPHAFAQHVSTDTSSRSWIAPAVLAAIALVHLVGGAVCLDFHLSAADPAPLRGTCGLSLILFSACQARVALLGYRRRDVLQLGSWRRWSLFARWLSIGWVLGYAAGLLVHWPGSRPYFVLIAAAGWYTLVAIVLVAPPRLVKWSRRLVERRAMQFAGWLVYLMLMTPLCLELGLRSYGLIMGRSWTGAYVAAQLKLPPRSSLGGLQVNSAGYWDDEFTAAASAAALRIALIGDEVTLAGDAATNFAHRLESSLPDVELYHFGLPGAGPREYAVIADQELARYRPDLVLVVLSVGNDITREPASPDLFDWRGLHTYQLGALWMTDLGGKTSLSEVRLRRPLDPHDYLEEATRRLVVCRTPMSQALRVRWDAVLGSLDRLVAASRRQKIPLAMVAMPAEFQVNAVLRRVLCRRAGYDEKDCDVLLPQRRLAKYAQERELPLIDLLPHLAVEGPSMFARNSPELSDEGQAEVANVLGTWLQRRNDSVWATTAGVR